MANHQSWAERPANGQYLIDSGLLFEINHQILHLFGLALTVNKEGGISIKDSRKNPEALVFSRETLLNALEKRKQFCEEYGYRQMDLREKKLGWSTQPRIYRENKKYGISEEQ